MWPVTQNGCDTQSHGVNIGLRREHSLRNGSVRYWKRNIASEYSRYVESIEKMGKTLNP
jgi:hypothetical protein